MEGINKFPQCRFELLTIEHEEETLDHNTTKVNHFNTQNVSDMNVYT